MLDYIVDRLDVNQYGGLRGLSTTHALVDMVHTWLLTAEERKASHMVLLDYRKAFDHVDHTVLVTKCKSYNLPNFIIRWLCAFLSDRPLISFHKQPIDISPICIEGIEIERVKSVKLLGIIVTDKITWNENTTYICSKASKRLYHLKQLRRAGLDSVDLLAFYESVIRSKKKLPGQIAS